MPPLLGGRNFDQSDRSGRLGSSVRAPSRPRALRPHRSGRVRATGTPIMTGRTQQIWLVEIERDDDGKMVARGQLRVQNLHRPAGTPGAESGLGF